MVSDYWLGIKMCKVDADTHFALNLKFNGQKNIVLLQTGKMV
jgi:hypothetical protein